MKPLVESSQAPEFTLLANNGKKVSLSDFHGKKLVVLYFYPKDDTPGCTVEACNFRDSVSALEKKGVAVLGVSPDGLESHKKFSAKFKLPFLLLSDPEKKVLSAYGVWIEKSMYGRKYMGVERSTYIIDKKGIIVKLFRPVKPENHHQEVLEFLEKFLEKK